VIRLWNAADVSGSANDASVTGAASADAERSAPHVYVAMITRERARTEWALVAVTRTVTRAVPPMQALANALQGWRSEMRSRGDGADMLLAWRAPRSLR
jgi:hypothetical protein